eukprot:CAMPEP_0184699650 /NCGR_PEP_ID=MMETSP0313-20130426/5847_1 /TAXON_ID=2792 /ORGANISM="Porphyridium aerugineum, Strain SAG 1380-2" /LENGTH=212 /DNA_ID=CAMNT_0027158769 /DNA_START=151 /DNA_END=789 /DNA_ORIENTATION=+
MELLEQIRDLIYAVIDSKIHRVIADGQKNSLRGDADEQIRRKVKQLLEAATKVQKLLNTLQTEFHRLLFDGTPKLIYDQTGEPTGEFTSVDMPANAQDIVVRATAIVNGIRQLQAGWEFLELHIPYVNALVLVFQDMDEAISANKEIEARVWREIKVTTIKRGEETMSIEQCLQKIQKLFDFAFNMLAERRSTQLRMQDLSITSSVSRTMNT